MSKELEALIYVWYHYYTKELDQYEVDEIEKNLNVVQDGLKRLESIDNAEPSKALELVGYLQDHHLNAIPYYDWLNDIEKYILKAQKEHKALEVIKEIIDFDLAEIGGRKVCIYSGNDGDDVVKMVSEEKFNILKEVLE